MDADSFRDAVVTATQTELDRLGSSKRLVAVTGADLSPETVLERAAASEAAAAETFWALADASEGDAAETFETLAETECDHYDRVVDDLGEDVDADAGAVHEFLREQGDAVSRAGATVGRGLVADRTLAQFVGFFVNDADEARADLFRDLRRDTEDDTDEAVALLASLCETEADWERAEAAATAAVDAVYEEYVAALNEMGVDAKSVC
ncbi:rubrerythrin family protein [Halobacterium jilantaiense]|uniref:Rubrerythrin n=1 Tax=Halobacterium jilantaiense TaxID=355548 RepID=A0A1I0NS17_9EURY|nr:rubrerythrin family protein [Halobacterium jilantaiense]SEW04227.1 hypothetical protein SAMN04487945_1095 [Halobacterium jilantaiense]